MRALVTGATGFLGSHIVERLIEQGHDVRALARRTSDVTHLKNTAADIVFGDIEDLQSLLPATAGVEVVFHAAARVTPGWGSWRQFESSTLTGTENMLKASAGAGVRRFLHVSTGGVYKKHSDSDAPVSEDAPCGVDFVPDNYYDCAKLQAEKVALDFHNRGAIQVTIIRIAAIYGPRDRLLADRVYRHMSPAIVVWPGKANPMYSIVYASDAADCAILAATSDRAPGQAYNVAPPNGILFRDFAAAMIQAMGRKKLQFTIPYSLGYAWCALMEGWSRMRRVKDMPYLTRSGLRSLNEGLFLDGSKARHELGWEPGVSIEEGTRLYVRWRREQKG